MEEIRVVVEMQGDPEQAWELLSDHAGFKGFPGIVDSRLEREGSPDRNGVGALRFLNAGFMQFTEEITAFDAPHRYDYQIRECSLPMEHHGGSVRLEPIPGGVRVEWTSKLRVPIPFFDWVAGPMAKMAGSEGFRQLLLAVKREVEAKGS